MTVWVYAVAERPDLPLPSVRGMDGALVGGVPAGELLAVVTRHEQPPRSRGADAFWAHERVVERVMDDRAVLPMRFNTTQPDDGTLRRALLARHDELRAALDRVRGRVEVGVRAIGNGTAPVAVAAPDPLGTAAPAPGDAAPDSPSSGREWIADRIEAGRLADSLHEPLDELAVASRRRPSGGSDEILRAAYLVDRSALPSFREAVERLQRPGVSLLCTGPWPPYSFV
jgi:Gas vesicle synthesis protein GvpL/GvpF